nr:MAG TPA: hypothetical protein [Caudoviricetes sp.]
MAKYKNTMNYISKFEKSKGESLVCKCIQRKKCKL